MSAGRPVPLGLVTADRLGGIGLNHQVVAYAVTRTDEYASVHVYDPNLPRADDVTIAALSIRKSRYHAIHVSGKSDSNTLRTLIYDVSILDAGEQAIKINASSGYYADDGEVACSRMEMTRAGEAFVTAQTSSGSWCSIKQT